MSAPDMDVIKEIPGYKVILKAVLKSQIQQLVEQLAAHTDEESVILTASVADGTLSHLGSDSGKGFLEDHEDVKSQFLGFCLKRHHKKQQAEEERKRQQQQQKMLESLHPMPIPGQLGYGPASRRNPRAPYPRQILPRGAGHPGMGMRSPGIRHEPYPQGRPQRNSTGSMPTTPVKLEPSDTSNDGVSESNNVNQSPSQSALSRDEDVSNSSSSTIPNELGDSNSGNNDRNTDQSELDPSVNVKVEAISEAEMELEITGVEPGRPVLSQDWDPNVSMGMNFDPNSGATGTAGDMQQGYKRRSQIGYWPCFICGKVSKKKQNLEIHLRTHTGVKPYKCELCDGMFRQRHHLQQHTLRKHNQVLLEIHVPRSETDKLINSMIVPVNDPKLLNHSVEMQTESRQLIISQMPVDTCHSSDIEEPDNASVHVPKEES